MLIGLTIKTQNGLINEKPGHPYSNLYCRAMEVIDNYVTIAS